jgi:hypothetical protein
VVQSDNATEPYVDHLVRDLLGFTLQLRHRVRVVVLVHHLVLQHLLAPLDLLDLVDQLAGSGKGVRLAQKMQVGPCIAVGIQL